jgi:acyl-CoA synthetase (AMP-forming)/AMP-acid ligase II
MFTFILDNGSQSLKKAPSIASVTTMNRHRLSSPPTPSTFHNALDKSKYGSSSMTKSFRNFESISIPSLPPNSVLEELAGRQMLPSSIREVPFRVVDVQDKKELDQFDNIAELLRYRASSNPTRMLTAMTQIDAKGKEASTLTWEKLGARAEKVAMVIKEKSSLQVGDRIGLVYQKAETLDFIVALFGCFLAGMVAVPINATEELAELWFILSISNAYLVLTTEQNLKTLTKTIKARNTEFPKGLDWWPIDDFGSLYPNQLASGHYTTIYTSPLAYIEYTKSVNGELKGVAVSHKSIMNNCHSFIGAATETIEFTNDQGVTKVLPNWDTQASDVVLTYLEHRQQVGLSLSIFCSVYNGNHTIFAGENITENPSVWIYTISKYKGITIEIC